MAERHFAAHVLLPMNGGDVCKRCFTLAPAAPGGARSRYIPHRLNTPCMQPVWRRMLSPQSPGFQHSSLYLRLTRYQESLTGFRAIAAAADGTAMRACRISAASRSAKAEAGTMPNLALAVPPPRTGARANSSQLIGSNADDPTADIARRLSTRFKRPIYLSLSNVAASKMAAATSGGTMMSLASSIVAPADEVAALEKCLVAELKRALSAD
ncbi:hypothetical protein GQ54DRAFT_72009 [Martensiomyces pterosporus]|nr:hypothetical protein GQ54DRAFT_72009 [Martensiomyces pterosporus]